MVALSESFMKNRMKSPLAKKSRRHIRLVIKSRYLGNHASQIKVTMERYQEVMITLLASVMKNRLKRPLAEKSWWRHIRLTIKPRYLGNHASQIKIEYGTLSGSHGRSFRIRHEKSLEALLSGEIMMSSYPACNKTSLSRKPCMLAKTLLRIINWKLWSLFQNMSWKSVCSFPWRRTTMTSWQ